MNENYKKVIELLDTLNHSELINLGYVLNQKIESTKTKIVNTTGVPDTFTLTGKQLQKWIENGIVPSGYEMFDKFRWDWIDIDSGEYDSSKYSMVDYDICLYINEAEENQAVWLGNGGYYNEGCGHQFNYDITFEFQNESN